MHTFSNMLKRHLASDRSQSSWRFLFMLFLMLLASPAAEAQCTGQWLPGHDRPFLDGDVNAMTHWDPDGPGPLPECLVIGGGFQIAGFQTCNRITIWDGTSFRALGAGFNNFVRSVVSFNGELIAGGDFTSSGGTTVNHIARWDGAAWQPLGTGMNARVRTLAVYGDNLIAGGEFTSSGGTPSYIARWNGTTWQAMGLGINHHVYTLANYGPELIAGGIFTSAGGYSQASGVTRWDGVAWRPLGTFNGRVINGTVWSLVVHNNELVVGGAFASAGGVTAPNIARWNGTTWQSFGSGTQGPVYSLAVYNNEVVAGGLVNPYNVVRWDGSAWRSLGGNTGADNLVRVMDVYQGELILGGMFNRVGPLSVPRLARWNGQWGVLGAAPDAPPTSFIPFAGQLMVAGGFRTVEDTISSGPMLWNGSSWRPTGTLPGGTWKYLTLHQGEPIVAGSRSVRRWTDGAWQLLGTEFSEGAVLALTTFKDDLVAAGYTWERVARWNGVNWQGLNSGIISTIFAAGTYNGDLIVTGNFSIHFGAPGDGIARFDGSNWHPVGAIAHGGEAMIVYNGDLIVPGGTTGLSRWDGTAWHPIGDFAPGSSIRAMALYNGDLIVGGTFSTVSGVPVNNIARWNGSTWRALGEGVGGGAPLSMTTHNGELVVGGYFATAGGLPSAYLARWTDSGVPWFSEHPAPAVIGPGDDAAFDVLAADGYAHLTFQWLRNGDPISDGPGGASKGGGVVAGAATSHLTIAGAARSDMGVYTCIVANPCGQSESVPATLDVACPADFNIDAFVNSQDFFDFLAAFFVNNPAADFNRDSFINSQDFFDFLASFFTGC
ncbi:MAG: immunoglobulin domain-containing protein [Pyrinomonadaceae bacterium]|nr:immunoglobulin domain-containing protein [Phycisphaerales bacterium]